MEITVLGSAGGEAPGLGLTGFRLGQALLLDAGTIGAQLSLEEQRRIRALLLTHAHLDHIHALPFLLDNLIGRSTNPVMVFALPEVLKTLHQHVFNGKIWPDFTVLPSREKPVVKLQPLQPGESQMAGDYQVELVPTNHSVPSAAFLITPAEGQGKAVAFTGDTAATEALWERLRACDNLGAIFMECSYPRTAQAMADLTRHLSLEGVLLELDKLAKPDVPVFLYHLKPEYTSQIIQEAAQVSGRRLTVVRAGDCIRV